MNSYKLLSVIDRQGRFIYARLCLPTNDREALTSSPLYLQQGEYFTDGEWIATDGGFQGDEPHRASFDDPRTESEQYFNVVFKEVRQTKEVSYERLITWFPILGNNKKRLPYSEKTLLLSVHAAIIITSL